MIKIERTLRPMQLTDEKVRELTLEYIQNNKNVWNQEYIKNALLFMSHNKCVFCECILGEESKYIEVEHFHPKSLYPEEVLKWSNLLSICKRCNGLKRDHDTKLIPIINPTENDPRQHLYMQNYRMKNKDEIGKRTIRLLQLNDGDRLLLPRFKIGNAVAEILDNLVKWIEKTNGTKMIEEENELISKVGNLLKSCQPDAEYSTTCSYALLSDENFYLIKRHMLDREIWNVDLEKLEGDCKKYCLINDTSFGRVEETC
ncbi:HNH endonuclease [Paenibacillus sonchi]|uniref:HNH endonuclease n=1 Tax=Paenibacillus sonchi TaxID=373687 RepID=A0A974P7S3_9BACL|nr:hypothetical protein [Paenibacillus sonchi]QQZ58984.1 HNH endonuclease [Paenibacillus sonchi]